MRLSKKLAIAAVSTVAAVSVATAAFAYWTSTGSGTGSATAGTSSPWKVTSDSATGGLLTPGGPTDSIAYHVKNDNSGVQHLNNVAISVSSITKGGNAVDPGDCSASDFQVGGEAVGTLHNDASHAGDIASGATVDGSVSLQMANGSGNQDGCKGVTVNLAFDAS